MSSIRERYDPRAGDRFKSFRDECPNLDKAVILLLINCPDMCAQVQVRLCAPGLNFLLRSASRCISQKGHWGLGSNGTENRLKE